MAYNDDNLLRDPLEAGRTLIDWCYKGMEYITTLKNTIEMTEDQVRSLDHWLHAFQSLERQTHSMLDNKSWARNESLDINELWQEGLSIHQSLSQFVQTEWTENRGVGSSQASNVHAEDNNNHPDSSDYAARRVPIGGHTLRHCHMPMMLWNRTSTRKRCDCITTSITKHMWFEDDIQQLFIC